MNTFEFWLGIQVAGAPACTVFGQVNLPIRPQVGERISFYQEKGSSYLFDVEMPGVGFSRENSVSVQVVDISHYAVRSEGEDQFMSAIRVAELNVRSLDDARSVRDFLCKQIGLGLDPYGTNALGE